MTVPAPPVLGVADPYWIFQPSASSSYSDVGAYTSDGNLYLRSGVDNLFGLTFATALVNNTPGSIVTLAPNSSAALTDVTCFYSQTTDPALTSDGYYFATVNTPGNRLKPGDTGPNQPSPLPVLAGFADTNQTGLMVASVGSPTVIGGWNKFAVTGSSAYAYLGQYYVTNAFVITNGVVTTNTTGVVSPYGDFFPTQVGQVAMVTMPDINTGQQGTGVVDVISLNVDANHDGTMDFSYGGPDFVSANNPFRFWINDDQDIGDDDGNGGVPGLVFPQADAQNPAGMNYQKNEYFYRVRGTRDLVDYFPVYINISSLFQQCAECGNQRDRYELPICFEPGWIAH